MNRKELAAEATRRYGSNRGRKPALPINRNQAGYKYRLLFIADDLKKGLNPYLEQSVPSVSEVLEVQKDDDGPQTRQ